MSLGARLRSPLALASAVLALGLGLAAGFRSIPFDEGFASYYGWRIAQGEWPYRDFWAYYAPGQFFVLGALNRVFSPWGALLAWDFAVRLALPALLLVWAQALGAGKRAWIAWGFAAVAMLSSGFRGYALFPALALGLLSLLLMVRSQGRWTRLAAAGLAAGVAAFIRQDIGAYLALLALAWTLRAGWRAMAVWFAVAGAVVLLLWGGVIQQAGLAAVKAQVWDFPSRWLHAGYALPYPALLPPLREGLKPLAHGVHVWVQFYGTLLLAGWLAWQAWRLRAWDRLPLLGFALLLFSQALNRPDGIHRLPAWLGLLPLLAAGPWAWRLPVKVLGLLLALHWGAEPLSRYFVGVRDAMAPPADGGQAAMAQELQQRTRSDEAVFVVNSRMDRALVNDIELYVRARRRAGAQVVEFHPGLSTDEAVQRAMVQQLDANGVRWIVRCRRFDAFQEPNLSAVPASPYFDRWLDASFTPRLRHADYELLERRP
jgi:hypothetical protein